MAKANPVAKPDAGTPSPADERVLPPVEASKAPAPAPKADPKDLQAMVDEAEQAGKKASIFGNAVRVDH